DPLYHDGRLHHRPRPRPSRAGRPRRLRTVRAGAAAATAGHQPVTKEAPVDPGRVRRSPDPLLLILAGLAAGVGLVLDREIRTGLYVCAGSLVAAALLRQALRPRAAGNLVLRSRHVDVAV